MASDWKRPGAAKKWLKSTRDRIRDQWWRIYGKRIRNPEVPEQVHSLVFVCKGNICRSPFAEHLARKIPGLGKIEHISSAGLCISNSEQPPEAAVLAAKEFGVDLSGHQSVRFDPGIANGPDMVVVMEAWQMMELRKHYPEQKASLLLLPLLDPVAGKEIFGYDKWNIRDPYGKSLDTFLECYGRIERSVLNLASCLRGSFGHNG